MATSLWVMENTVYNECSGELYSDRTWTYKIIGAKDIPYDFRVYLRRKRPNPVGILGSKGTNLLLNFILRSLFYMLACFI